MSKCVPCDDSLLNAAFSGANRVFPEGRGNYFSGRDMSNGGFRLR